MAAVEISDAPRSELEAAEHAADATAEQLSAAQRARIERNRLQARQRRDARLVQRHSDGANTRPAAPAADSGGGFLLDTEEPAPPPRALPPPAPIQDPAERPSCLECDRLFPQSYLFDTFGHNVCDECRSVQSAVRSPAPTRLSLTTRSPQGRRGRARARHAHRGEELVPTEGLRPGPAAAAAALRAAPQPARLAPGRHAPVPARAGAGARARGVGLGRGAGGRAHATRPGARSRQAHGHGAAPARAAHGRALEPVRPHARHARARVRCRAVRRGRRPVLARLRLWTRRDLRKDVKEARAYLLRISPLPTVK